MQKRVNITIDENILKQIDKAAELRGLSRSAFIATTCENLIRKDLIAENKRLIKKLRLLEKEKSQ